MVCIPVFMSDTWVWTPLTLPFTKCLPVNSPLKAGHSSSLVVGNTKFALKIIELYMTKILGEYVTNLILSQYMRHDYPFLFDWLYVCQYAWFC